MRRQQRGMAVIVMEQGDQKLSKEPHLLQECINRLEAEVKRLQAMQWVPVLADNTLLLDAEADGDRRMYLNEQGTSLELYLEGVYKIFSLPDGYAVCRRMPQPPP